MITDIDSVAECIKKAVQQSRSQAKQQEQELVPLISQIIEIKYARATDLAALLKNGENTLLSNRGQVSVDERTNTLLLQDIETKLNDIKALVKRLDAPVKQVLIESRIVVANDDFGRDLGARFGVFNTDDKHLANGKTTNVIGRHSRCIRTTYLR